MVEPNATTMNKLIANTVNIAPRQNAESLKMNYKKTRCIPMVPFGIEWDGCSNTPDLISSFSLTCHVCFLNGYYVPHRTCHVARRARVNNWNDWGKGRKYIRCRISGEIGADIVKPNHRFKCRIFAAINKQTRDIIYIWCDVYGNIYLKNTNDARPTKEQAIAEMTIVMQKVLNMAMYFMPYY